MTTPDAVGTSWGRLPEPPAAAFVPFSGVLPEDRPYLPYGAGRSYGDVCLNDGATLVAMTEHHRILEFDQQLGTLVVESGCTIAQVHQTIIPSGWHLPVIPGTQWVTIGGAVANDIHGKNHHRDGSFGCHVLELELLRSDEGVVRCSPTQRSDLFYATIGGMGLTGIITWVKVRLMPIPSAQIQTESIKTSSMAETVDVLLASDEQWLYSVAWVDLATRSGCAGRGHVLVGQHASAEHGLQPPSLRQSYGWLAPVARPFLQPTTVRLGNSIKYHGQRTPVRSSVMDHGAFFHPLDAIRGWNRVYDPKGFVQYQFVIPEEEASEVGKVLSSITTVLHEADLVPYLAVLKRFGPRSSGGVMSFPRPGWTLAMDLPWSGRPMLHALNRLDAMVLERGGRVYLAKDARLETAMFRAMYPQWTRFSELLDPAVSSTMWRRLQLTTKGYQ